ncbi:hypothetical protein ACH5RR_032347 [Cinchona calisaya]|uniref:Uncharacterized protein n=1 Tax=Cinchona calisaya TaxID=153742 RepID=A0ABD2YM23_9GENT
MLGGDRRSKAAIADWFLWWEESGDLKLLFCCQLLFCRSGDVQMLKEEDEKELETQARNAMSGLEYTLFLQRIPYLSGPSSLVQESWWSFSKLLFTQVTGISPQRQRLKLQRQGTTLTRTYLKDLA